MAIVDARFYKTLLISPTRLFAAELTPILARQLPLAPIQQLNTYPGRRELADELRVFEPKLCVLDFAADVEAAFTALGELQSLAETLPVVALLKNNNPDIVLRCMRNGAMDFLIHPFTVDQIESCVDKITRLLPTPMQTGVGGKVIAVMPAKGASGATTLACNLAFQCKRLGASRILLADLDALTGTVSFVLKLKSTYSFVDVLLRQSQLDVDLWKQMVVPSSGVDVLLAPENVVDAVDGLQSAASIVEFAQANYEGIVLDTSGPYGQWNLSIARICDQLLLVSSNELASLQAVQKVMAYLEHNRVNIDKVRLVLSRYSRENGMSSEAAAEALGLELFQVVASEPDAVQKSLMDGKPIASGTALGKSLAALADKLLEFRNNDDKKSSAKGGLLSSFFTR